MLNAKLMVVGGDAKRSEIQLRLPTVIGRGREATLTLPHPLVSRRHTEIFEQDGHLVVRDLGSLNGTFVNNQRIEGDQVLAPNQLLTLGNVTFRAVYDVTDLSKGDHLSVAQAIEVSDNVPEVNQEDGTEASQDKPGNQSNGQIETGACRTPELDSNPNEGLVNQEGGQCAAEPASVCVSDALGQTASPDSVLLSGLSGLSDQVSSSIELAEPLVLDSQPQANSSIDLDEFQFDESGNRSAIDPNQSDLGSFLKKLPR